MSILLAPLNPLIWIRAFWAVWINRKPRETRPVAPVPTRAMDAYPILASYMHGPLSDEPAPAVLVTEAPVVEKTEPAQTHAQEVVELPRDKTTAQKILRKFGYRGLKIDAIEAPRDEGFGCASARIYALTQPKLVIIGWDKTTGDPLTAMRRKAVTVLFVYDGSSVEAKSFDGWIVL